MKSIFFLFDSEHFFQCLGYFNKDDSKIDKFSEDNESYIPPYGKCIPFMCNLSDGLKKMRLNRPISGFRLYIFTACRAFDKIPYYTRRKYLEYEMYFQHKNSLIDKQCNKDKVIPPHFTKNIYVDPIWCVNTFNMTHIIHNDNVSDFKERNSHFKYNWYNGRTPSLIEENYDYKEDLGAYLSTFSVNKIIKYLIKKDKDEVAKLNLGISTTVKVPEITPLQFFIKNQLYDNSDFDRKINLIYCFLGCYTSFSSGGDWINNMKCLIDCIEVILEEFRHEPEPEPEKQTGIKGIKNFIFGVKKSKTEIAPRIIASSVKRIKDFIKTDNYKVIYDIIKDRIKSGDDKLPSPEDLLKTTDNNTLIISSDNTRLDSYMRPIYASPSDLKSIYGNITHIILESSSSCNEIKWSDYKNLRILEINNINKNISLKKFHWNLRDIFLRGSSLDGSGHEVFFYDVLHNHREYYTNKNQCTINFERVNLKKIFTNMCDFSVKFTDCIIQPTVDFNMLNIGGDDIFNIEVDLTGVTINMVQWTSLLTNPNIKKMRLKYFSITDAVGDAAAGFKVDNVKLSTEIQLLEIISNELIKFDYDILFSNNIEKNPYTGLKVKVYNCKNSQTEEEVKNPKSRELMDNNFVENVRS